MYITNSFCKGFNTSKDIGIGQINSKFRDLFL